MDEPILMRDEHAFLRVPSKRREPQAREQAGVFDYVGGFLQAVIGELRVVQDLGGLGRSGADNNGGQNDSH